jgi:hypothetical protein
MSVLQVLKAADPEANEARQERINHRRVYDITEAMVLWHIDSAFRWLFLLLVNRCL